jgi:hypothetical protein
VLRLTLSLGVLSKFRVAEISDGVDLFITQSGERLTTQSNLGIVALRVDSLLLTQDGSILVSQDGQRIRA